VVEHPELVAQRRVRFADILGRERVMAATDRGLGIRTDPNVAWAQIASRKLWGRNAGR